MRRMKGWILLILICLENWLHAQPGTIELQKQLDDLRSRIRSLEKENDQIKTENRTGDSAEYASIRTEIFEAVTNIPQLDFNFTNTTDKIAVTGLFTRLMQANNPSSDILGFRFTEIIFSACEKHFKDVLKDEKDKKRFSLVIGKIIDNPVVSSLANTNPVSSVVAAIISTIAGFTTNKVELEKEGGKIKDVSVEQQDAFDNKNLAGFRKELQVYIDFYDALIVASASYLKGLENLKGKYAYLANSVEDYKTSLFHELGLNEDNYLIGLSSLLPDPSTAGINYSILAHDPEIRTCRHIAGRYALLQQDVNDFKDDYNQLLFKFLESYITTLRSAKLFPEGNIDLDKTDALVLEIENFIRDQKNKWQAETGAFK